MKRLIHILFALFASASAFAQGAFDYVATASGTDTYAATILVPSFPSSYTGVEMRVTFTNANTGASTINISRSTGAIGAAPIRKWDGDSFEPLVSGDIPAGEQITLRYTGSYFIMESFGKGSTGGGGGSQNLSSVLTTGNDAGGAQIKNIGAPSSSQDATTRAYVDGTADVIAASYANLNSFKRFVKAATTTNGTLANSFEAGDVLDGVTLSLNDDILLKNQTTATENGIYVVATSGAPTRRADANNSSEFRSMVVAVEQGAVNDNTIWLQTTDTPILGSNNLVFQNITSGGGVSSVFGRTGVVVAATSDYDAIQIDNTPSGNISSTNAQAAINELDTEKQPLDADLTAIAALSPSNDDIVQRKSGAWTNRTPAQLKADLALTKSDVGLANVDNTADLSKPISTATQTALDGKASSTQLQKTVSTTTYTVLAGDNGYLIHFTNASGCTVTMPNGFAANFVFTGKRDTGAGVVLFASDGTSVLNTINSEYDIEQVEGWAVWVKKNTTNWDGTGALGPAGGGGGSGIVETVVPGNLVDVNATDPANPVVLVESGDKGDVTIGSNSLTVDNNAITFAKMQAITDNRLLGAQGGTAVEEISTTANDFDLTSNNLSIDYTNGQKASGSVPGFLSQTDWNTFNNKVGSADFVYVRPEDYGAVGDGVTNDAAAIQAAIRTGKAVQFSNKIYLVSATTKIGNAWKTAVATASTGNLTLSGEQTIDGVLTSGSRVLVKNQSTGSQNGIYVSAAGAWSRSTDADVADELNAATVSVSGGTTQAGTTWIQTADPITLNTTALTWVAYGNANSTAPQKIVGNNTVISTTSNIAIFTFEGSYAEISGITFQGNATGAAQRGISVVGNAGLTLARWQNKVENCNFINLAHAGVYVTNVFGENVNRHQGAIHISKSFAKDCGRGILFDARAEYNTVVDFGATTCDVGIEVAGGNNMVIGGDLNNCVKGAYIIAGTNDGHGAFIGTRFNHCSSFGIHTNAVAKNYLFLGCFIYAADINFAGVSSGVRLQNCEISTSTITHGASATNISIENCFFEDTPTVNVSGGQICAFNNKYRLGVVPAGLMTNCFNGDLSITRNSSSITQVDNAGIVLLNNDQATLGSTRISPGTTQKVWGYKTNATAGPQLGEFRTEVQAVQGTSVPTFNWRIVSQVNLGGYSTSLFQVNHFGNVSVPGGNFTVTQPTGTGGNLLRLNKSGEVFSVAQEAQTTWTSPGYTLGSSSTITAHLLSTGPLASGLGGAGNGRNAVFAVANTYTTANATSTDGIGVFDLRPTYTLSAQTPYTYGVRYDPTTTGTPTAGYGWISTATLNGFGTMTPTSTVHVNGSHAWKSTIVTTTTTLDGSHNVIYADATSGAVTINLPPVAGVLDRVYIIKRTNSGANNVTLDGNSAETIDGSATQVLSSQYSFYHIQALAAGWMIIGQN